MPPEPTPLFTTGRGTLAREVAPVLILRADQQPRPQPQPQPQPRRALAALWLAVLFLLGSAPALYLGLTDIGVYNSPDETSRYLTARAFAETGRLAIADPVSALDLTGSAGPRGFVQNGNEITTIYPLGQPALVGLVYRFFGDAAVVALAVVPGLLMAALGAVMWRLQPSAPAVTALIVTAALPVSFWSSFVHLDVGLAWTFAVAGLLGWVQALRTSHLGWVLAGSAGFALAALMRHQEAPFLLLLALSLIAGLIVRAPRDWRRGILVLGAYALPQIVLFLLPMAMLNAATYGSAGTFGNTLFYKELFPERLPEAEGPAMQALGILTLAFFPQPVNVETMVRGTWVQIFLMSPPLVILGLYGAWHARRKLLAALGPASIALLVLTLCYVIASRSDPGVIGAGAWDPDLGSSLSRYYWPVYMALALSAGVALAAMKTGLSRAILVGMLALSGYTMWLSPTHSIPSWQALVIEQRDRFAPLLDAATEPDAVVYTGNIDKWLVKTRRMISFWQEGGATYEARSMLDPSRIAADAATIHAAGHPVYFLFREANGENIAAVEGSLGSKGFGVAWVERFGRGLDLWRLEPLPVQGTAARLSPQEVLLSWTGGAPGAAPRLERRTGFGGAWLDARPDILTPGTARVAAPLTTRPVFFRAMLGDGQTPTDLPMIGPAAPLQTTESARGWHVANATAKGAALRLWIAGDGRSGNAISNPSFETGLDGWRGADPGPSGTVAATTAQSAAGEAALRMELSPGPAGRRIARTYRIDAASLDSALWSLRGQALVARANAVAIELRLIAKGADGGDVLFARARAGDDAERGFAPLAIEGQRLPADTVSLEVQMTVIALEDGAQALVFWDAIELRPHARLPVEYLDGDAEGADWRGTPHAAPSTRPGGIAEIRLTHRAASGADPATSVILPGPALRGEMLHFEGGTVSHLAQDGSIRARRAFPALEPGDRIEVTVRADGQPALALLPEGGTLP